MRVAFRTDASLAIGTGHVMRCLALADALHERGATCRFVCREHPGNLIGLIRQRGYEVCGLPVSEPGNDPMHTGNAAPSHAVWLGARWEEDAEQTKVSLGGMAADWLITDHYMLDARWERVLRPYCQRLMVIDDLADRPHDCDLLLDQNLGREVLDYAALVPAQCRLLIGPIYALLRPEFAEMRPRSIARREHPQLRRICITMGGVDKDNITGKVLDALQSCRLPPDCHITVVMGAQAPGLDTVRQQARTMPWLTEVQVNVQDMAALMAESDLAIGAAGSTSWERCCLGLPSLLFVIADNQKSVAQALANAEAVRVIELGAHLSDVLREELGSLLAAPELLHRMSVAASAVTDGQGINRILSDFMFIDEPCCL